MGEMTLTSPITEYFISKELGRTDCFNLYLCKTKSEQQCILKIAASMEKNGFLDREAILLGDMRDEAKRIEAKYDQVKLDPNRSLNYHLCFWDLVETFIAPTQGNRRVNILRYPILDDLSTLVPIQHIVTRDHLRVDRKTSAWMMGKLLKFLVFAHSQGVSLGPHVAGDNILVERKEHYIVLFDLTEAVMHREGTVPADIAREEISKAAQEVICVLGGDLETEEMPADEQDPDNHYARYMFLLARGSECDAKQAHTRFYELVRSLWPRSEYWQFTSYPLERRES
ncbi:MAG: hypothetical protein G01um101470_633 [Parcubacteria group bacterium Gr01-1014_70]|nr:MAG: hypothetical protein G01um101470_633 [Parcubacteria group bacterium Gr01-1014_70]